MISSYNLVLVHWHH